MAKRLEIKLLLVKTNAAASFSEKEKFVALARSVGPTTTNGGEYGKAVDG